MQISLVPLVVVHSTGYSTEGVVAAVPAALQRAPVRQAVQGSGGSLQREGKADEMG